MRYQWKMPTAICLQSTIYIALQAIDIASMETYIFHGQRSQFGNGFMDHVIVFWIIVIGISTTALTLACTAILTPPMYLGVRINARYMIVCLTIGCMFCDVPFIIIRLLVMTTTMMIGMIDVMEMAEEGGRPQTSGLFDVFFVKNVVSVVLLLCYGVRRIRRRRRQRTYEGQREDNDTLRMISDAEREDTIDDFT